MKSYLIDRYKKFRFRKFVKERTGYQHQYAFIGAGNHSLSNLYPVLEYLNVPLKYIHSRSSDKAQSMASIYPGARACSDLNEIIQDEEIGGVFISISPNHQFDVASSLLEAGKNVFVEKPPCSTLDELQQLIEFDSRCVIGVQKRYSSINKYLKGLKGVRSYTYRYLTGAYPEGDALLDLFIHPIDNIVFLFGSIQHAEIKVLNESTFVLAEHDNGIVGTLELSTDYSWNSFTDILHINTSKRVYTADYPDKLSHYKKPGSVVGIPLEKLTSRPVNLTYDYHNTGSVPVSQYNSLVEQGYMGELQAFLALCEKGLQNNPSNPSGLLPTYKIIEEIRSRSS